MERRRYPSKAERSAEWGAGARVCERKQDSWGAHAKPSDLQTRERLRLGLGSFALCWMSARKEERARRREIMHHSGIGLARMLAIHVAAPTELCSSHRRLRRLQPSPW